ncbi:hypothetical protein HJC23_013968 [Cyclotella cryptica]|uniref:Nudix hydrolase domain-containing protein n=1 Tax=Cyclotella cryptica TaxID=29204 RepID=A0ABD3Q2W4_9STRA
MDNSINDTSDQKNYQIAQNDHELFDVYPSPPSPSHYNRLITPAWGDTYFPCPNPTGTTNTRRQIHRQGDWHRSVQVWIAQRVSHGANNSTIRVLLQRRSRYKDTHPNLLDVSCAGHVDAGENIIDCAYRELREELGGLSDVLHQYTHDDLTRGKAFVVTSSIQGETKQFGSFICNEYQDVFILWWKDDNVLMEAHMFAPMNNTEVEGFEVVDGRDLIQRLRRGDEELVPHSMEYVDALARAFSLE